MYRRLLILCALLLAATAVSACQPEPTATPSPTPLLPTPTATPSLQGAETVARDYLRAWQDGAYERMYGMLSPSAQDSTLPEEFVSRHQAIAREATLTSLTASISAVERVVANAARVEFTLTLDSEMAGQFQVENALELSYAGQDWAVDWAPQTIFRLLVYDNLVHMFIDVPARGSIYARDGEPLATNGKLIEIGVVPEQIEDEAALLGVLSALLGLTQEHVQSSYAHAGRPDWFMPVGELTPEAFRANEDWLSSVPGITWREKGLRVYPQGNLAGQTIGHVAEIDAETLAQLEPEGYRAGDQVGASGLESWGEEYLAGERGGTLAIISPDGRIVWTLSQRAMQPGSDITTTLDLSLQRQTRDILAPRVGAIVALDVHSGQVLALVSYPEYDPNVFISGSSEQRQALLDSAQRPFLNRALAGQYPPGSSFKIVTMSAGMEQLGLTQYSTYYCAGRWDGLRDGATRTCWLHSGHGSLNYLNGLVYSCDTVFWEVGLALNERDPYGLPSHARAFGLGAPAGLNALDEASGLIPDPEWKAAHYSGAERDWLPRDAVNMAIGQGDVLATPLQMANLAAAVANGGTLYAPLIVSHIHSPLDGKVQTFGSEVRGQLPVSAATLHVVREALRGVVTYGTASRAFAGSTIAMAGKSGTAEAPPFETHAWFAGYAPAENPQIAVAVVLEHGGEGGGDAAPLFRRVVEAYMALAGSG